LKKTPPIPVTFAIVPPFITTYKS
jgi:hypothetical protein